MLLLDKRITSGATSVAFVDRFEDEGARGRSLFTFQSTRPPTLITEMVRSALTTKLVVVVVVVLDKGDGQRAMKMGMERMKLKDEMGTVRN